jgi:hypothetical protein
MSDKKALTGTDTFFMKTTPSNLLRACAAAVAALATFIPGQADARMGNAIARKVAGPVSYIDHTGKTQPLTVGTVLEEGWTIQTGAGGVVDLFMEHNGPYVGLFADTTVKLSRLRYEPGVLGEIIETELNVPRGQILARVNKLLAGSRYEVISGRVTGKVRGTDFWWSAITGEIHNNRPEDIAPADVTAGTIAGLVQVQLNLIADPGGDPYTKTMNVQAGQTLFIPQQILLIALLGPGIPVLSTEPRPIPQGVIDRLILSFPAAGHFRNSASSTLVSETFAADYLDAQKRRVLLKFQKGSPDVLIDGVPAISF